MPNVLYCLADLFLPVRVAFGLRGVLEGFVEFLKGHLPAVLLDDREDEVAPRLVAEGAHVVVPSRSPGDGNDEAGVFAGHQKVLVYDGDEVSGVALPIGPAVMLRLDDDILYGAGLDEVENHRVQFPFLFPVADESEHPASLFQGRKLLHHTVVHHLDELVPVGEGREVVAADGLGGQACGSLDIGGFVLAVCELYHGPVRWVPEDCLSPVRDVHGKHVVSAVEVREIPPDAGFPDDVLRRAAADHEVGEALELVLGDKVLDEQAGAVAPVGVAAVRAAVWIGYYGLHGLYFFNFDIVVAFATIAFCDFFGFFLGEQYIIDLSSANPDGVAFFLREAEVLGDDVH